jgi:FMN phosphatase YigB (HAD superfamily)
MEEEIEVVAFACRGTLLDWSGAIEAVAYELARCNGESPLDRGAALRRRVETLADGHGLARGFERLARERGYRGEESGEESLARVVALARPLRGAREIVAHVVRSGKRLVAVSRAENPGALYLFGGAFEAVLGDLDAGRIGAAPGSVLYVTASAGRREEARLLGMRAVAPGDLAGALAPWRPDVRALGVASIAGQGSRRAAVAA